MGRLSRYHHKLFNWHSEHFFDFNKHLDYVTLRYLFACFDLPVAFIEITDLGSRHFSYFSYSHRVDQAHVNSSRLAFGSVRKPNDALIAARPVLEKRAIDVDNLLNAHPGLSFYGIGVDVEEELFKLYVRCDDVNVFQNDQPDLYRAKPKAVDPEGLFSLTFKNSDVVERKLYFYPPVVTTVLPEGSKRQVVMATTERHAVNQWDVDDAMVWRSKLNAAAKSVLARYDDVGIQLDTIAYDDADHATLYFP